jgi:DUF438 domain-containing protein
MTNENLLNLILDSWNKPIIFVDNNHIIQYMNVPAKKHYEKWGDVVGKSIFDCHNDDSKKIIKESWSRLQKGEDEVLFTDSEKHRVYLRGVRDRNGKLLGYYERYEPPLGG